MTHESPAGPPRAPSDGDDEGRAASAESILLTDPDGAVTRVAPWSAWTREQRRAPGGEPSLLTRLDEGQLWFSAGSPGSPWRHEVHIGTAVVSTPRGRFHAIAEDDGGATVACLAGRTRVGTASREPVLLDADQTVAVSSDGVTLVVMNREAEIDPMLRSSAMRRARRSRRWRLPELAAMAALVAVLLGTAFVFGRDLLPTDEAVAPVALPTRPVIDNPPRDLTPTGSTAPVAARAELEVPATGPIKDDDATPAVPAVPADPTPVAPAQLAPVTAQSGTATGLLTGCRRSASGVVATVDIRHRSGGPDRFTVEVVLVDRTGSAFATGSSRSPVIEPSTSSTIEIAVEADSAARGACELTGVTAA